MTQKDDTRAGLARRLRQDAMSGFPCRGRQACCGLATAPDARQVRHAEAAATGLAPSRPGRALGPDLMVYGNGDEAAARLGGPFACEAQERERVAAAGKS